MPQSITVSNPKAKPNVAYVRKYAWKAFAAAAGTSATPARYASVAEGIGYDPLTHMQEAMVREISIQSGRDLRHVHREHASPLSGHMLARASRGVARNVVSLARRTRALSKVVGKYGLVVEIVTAGIFGTYAYFNTRKLGMACLATVDLERGDE